MKTSSPSKVSSAIAFLMALSLVFLGVPLASPEPAAASGTTLSAQSAGTLKTQAAKTSASAASELGLTSGHTYVLYSAVRSTAVLDVEGESKSDGANTLIWSLNRNANQQWVVKINSKGYATFKALHSGKMLSAKPAKAGNGINVVQRKSNGSKAQRWKITKNANGTFRISSALSLKYSLDVYGAKGANGTNVNIWANNTSKAQQWKFFDVTAMRKSIATKAKKNKGTVKAGSYFLFSKAGSSMALDVNGASKANAANLQTYPYHGGAAQQFTISYDKNGYALIKNSSGKYLDVYGGRAASGTNVQQYKGNGSLGQRWIITKNANGTYRVQSALWKNISLDVAGGSARKGTNVQIYSDNSSTAQQWRILTPAEAKKAAAVALSGTTKSSFNGISLSGAKAVGVDVSVWQGDVNWTKVAASGVKFAIIRCGYGSNIKSQDDSTFLANVNGARAAGLGIGVYLYSYATTASGAKSEADHTLRLLNAAGLTPSKVKYGVYLDVEDPYEQAKLSNGALKSICSKYCSTIAASGYSVGVYSSLSWWNSKLTDSAFSNWNRWIAQWPYKTGGRTCDYTGKYKLWQCMSDGSVPGIVGRVDMDIAY